MRSSRWQLAFDHKDILSLDLLVRAEKEGVRDNLEATTRTLPNEEHLRGVALLYVDNRCVQCAEVEKFSEQACEHSPDLRSPAEFTFLAPGYS